MDFTRLDKLFGTISKFNNYGAIAGTALGGALLGGSALFNVGDLLSGIGSMWNGTTGADLTPAQRAQNQFNMQEAQKAREWQEQMSNTAYQRQVSDMRAAGINPGYMYGNSVAGGASTPSSPTASAGSLGAGADLFGTIVQLLTLSEQFKNWEVQRDNTEANTENTEASTENTQTDTEVKKKTMEKMDKEMEQMDANIGKIFADKDKVNAETFILSIQGKYADQKERASLDNLLKDLNVKDAQISKADAEAALAWADTKLKTIISEHQGALMDAQTEAARASAKESVAMASVQEYTQWYRDNHAGMEPPRGQVGAVASLCYEVSNNLVAGFNKLFGK